MIAWSPTLILRDRAVNDGSTLPRGGEPLEASVPPNGDQDSSYGGATGRSRMLRRASWLQEAPEAFDARVDAFWRQVEARG